MKRIRTSFWRVGLAAVLAAALLAPATARWPFQPDGDQMPTLAPLLKEVTPGVVNLATRARLSIDEHPLLKDPFFRRFLEDPRFRRFFGLPEEGPLERQVRAVGSGVIVDAQNGYVLTNHHVIANAGEIIVTLTDKRELKARVLGSDPETDIGVLQIPAQSLRAVPFGNSDELQVGDFVIAIGNPFGLGQTVTSGIVSALGRMGLGLEGYEDFIQTDASINPGNSGGALINLRGELVGINTAILSPAGANIGIGFAIPVNMARRVLDQIVEFGEVRRGVLGVLVQDLTPDLAEGLRLERTTGAIVADVASGSPAERAGLRRGDVIVSVDDEEVRSGADLRNRIGMRRAGETVRLGVIRDRRVLTLDVEIREAASGG